MRVHCIPLKGAVAATVLASMACAAMARPLLVRIIDGGAASDASGNADVPLSLSVTAAPEGTDPALVEPMPAARLDVVLHHRMSSASSDAAACVWVLQPAGHAVSCLSAGIAAPPRCDINGMGRQYCNRGGEQVVRLAVTEGEGKVQAELVRAESGEVTAASSLVPLGLEVDAEENVIFNPETGSLPLVGVPAATHDDAAIETTLEPDQLPESPLFRSFASCGPSDSCRFTSVIFSNPDSTVYLLRLVEGQDMPVLNLTVSTHKRQLESKRSGWTDASLLWSMRSDLVAREAQPAQAAQFVAPGAFTQCIATPIWIFALAFPLHYWHVVVEGIIPVAHMLRLHEAQGLEPPQFVLAQGATGRYIPRFVAELLSALTDRVLLDLNSALLDGPVCVKELIVGHAPEITDVAEMFASARYLMKRMGVRPPTTERPTSGPRRLVIAQRGQRCYKNYKSHSDEDRPARSLVNAPALARIAAAAGFAVQIVHFELLSVAEQMAVMRDVDVFVAVHGSAWANTLFLPSHSVAIQLFGYAMRHPRCTKAQQYRTISKVRCSAA